MAKQVVVNTNSKSQRKHGNLSLAPWAALDKGVAQNKVDSPPQNLQNPLTALFGDRMTSRKSK